MTISGVVGYKYMIQSTTNLRFGIAGASWLGQIAERRCRAMDGFVEQEDAEQTEVFRFLNDFSGLAILASLGFAQKLFPIFLEEDVRNIRVRKIINPAPLGEKVGLSFFCPHFAEIAFFLKMFELRPRSGSRTRWREWRGSNPPQIQ